MTCRWLKHNGKDSIPLLKELLWVHIFGIQLLSFLYFSFFFFSTDEKKQKSCALRGAFVAHSCAQIIEMLIIQYGLNECFAVPLSAARCCAGLSLSAQPMLRKPTEGSSLSKGLLWRDKEKQLTLNKPDNAPSSYTGSLISELLSH